MANLEKNIEKEIKYILKKDDFKRLESYLENNYKKGDTVININHYIDTEDFLIKKSDNLFRLREIQGEAFECTIKHRLNKNDNLHIKEEYTKKLTEEEFNRILAQGINKEDKILLDKVQKYTEDLENKKLNIVGKMKTERTFYTIEDSIEPINLDVNYYLGIEDYEIEWETNKVEQVYDILGSILSKLNIRPLDINESKSTRFYKSCNFFI